MTLRHFQIFIEVVRCKKMKLAAEHLYVAQPTVSQAIAELEKHYEVKLFERYPSGLVITEAGQNLYHQALHLLESYEHLEETMQHSNQTYSLRIGGTLTVGHSILRPILKGFLAENTSTRVQVTIDNTHAMEELLLSNQLDAALVEGIIQHPHLKVFPTVPDYLVMVCAPTHPFAKREMVTPEELAGEDFLMREPGSGTRLLFEQFMQNHKYPFHIAWTCSNPDTIKRAVMDGFGLSVISIRMVEEEIRGGSLCLVKVKGCSWKRHFSLVYHKDKFLTPQLNAFLDYSMNYESNNVLALLQD